MKVTEDWLIRKWNSILENADAAFLGAIRAGMPVYAALPPEPLVSLLETEPAPVDIEQRAIEFRVDPWGDSGGVLYARVPKIDFRIYLGGFRK